MKGMFLIDEEQEINNKKLEQLLKSEQLTINDVITVLALSLLINLLIFGYAHLTM